MCNYSEMILEKGHAEGRAEGETFGLKKGRILTYAEIGMHPDEIAQKMQISVSEVEKILKENGVLAMV